MGILIVIIVWVLLYGAYILRHFLDTPFDWLIAGAIIGFIALMAPDDWLKRLMAMIAWTRGPGSRTRKLWEWLNRLNLDDVAFWILMGSIVAGIGIGYLLRVWLGVVA